MGEEIISLCILAFPFLWYDGGSASTDELGGKCNEKSCGHPRYVILRKMLAHSGDSGLIRHGGAGSAVADCHFDVADRVSELLL